MSKVIEKIVKIRATDFIDSNKILYERQFGFRSGLSTDDAVLEFVDSCSSELDKKQHTISVFLDLSKAFDTVNKNIMLGKLDKVGFRGLTNDWFSSYLSDRRMYCDVGGYKSNTKVLNIGLPQGSVTAP